MILNVDPGRNTVSKIAVRLAVVGQDVHFATTTAEGLDGSPSAILLFRHVKLTAQLAVAFTADAHDALVLQDLSPYTSVRVAIPLTGNIVDPNVQVRLPLGRFQARSPAHYHRRSSRSQRSIRPREDRTRAEAYDER